MQRTQTLDEPALVRRAQADAQAFGDLYDRYIIQKTIIPER